MVILGLERFEQFHEIVAAHERGQIPPTVMWGACPTLFDPSQAPPGRHTAFMWEKLPYALHGDADELGPVADEHGQRLLEALDRVRAEPGRTRCSTLSPARRSTPSARCRTCRPATCWSARSPTARSATIGRSPAPGSYRTPVAGLYLCGGSTHPGGNITGLCGYNAARVIAADLGCPIWWNPPDAEQALRSLT